MDEQSALNELERKVLLGKKLGVFDDREGRQLLKCYQHGILDSFVVGRINGRVTAALRRLALSGSPFLPHKLHRGNFIFGLDPQGNLIRIDRQYLNAHVLILGGTGSGKSNQQKFRATLLAPFVSGIWLFDIRKAEYRALRPVFKRMGIDLKVIRSRMFQLNPLQVPLDVEPIEYAAVAAGFLVRALDLPPRAATLLSSTIITLYREHGILNGGRKYPTLFHLFEAVRTNRNAHPQARQAVLDNLGAVLQALGPEILGYHCGWEVHQLARHHLVCELAGWPDSGKNVVLDYLLTAEFVSRVARGISNCQMNLWISFDESRRLFSQRQETASHGGSGLTDLVGLVRGTGIGLEISVLTTHDLSAYVPNLTSTKIMGRCGSITEYTAAGRFMGLNAEQIEWCAHHLVPGLFVGQVGEGHWRYPFLFTVPLVDRIDMETLGAEESTDDPSEAVAMPTDKAHDIDGRFL